jgi:hypothetical protein
LGHLHAVAEEDMMYIAMVAMAMAMANDSPQANILFNWWQSCLPYWINLQLFPQNNITLTTTLAKITHNGGGMIQNHEANNHRTSKLFNNKKNIFSCNIKMKQIAFV